MMAGHLYLDDLHVGQRFAAGPIAVSAADIKSFAAAFDPQPFHLDEASAKTTLFKGLIASGWHTAALTMRLLAEGGVPIATGVIGVGGEIAWPRPVRPGDELRVESEVLARSGRGDGAQHHHQPERRGRADPDGEARRLCAAVTRPRILPIRARAVGAHAAAHAPLAETTASSQPGPTARVR
jgi:acyl dehydratase